MCLRKYWGVVVDLLSQYVSRPKKDSPSSPCPPPLFCTIKAALMEREDFVAAECDGLLDGMKAAAGAARRVAKMAEKDTFLDIILEMVGMQRNGMY
jgi:hypothetical protein